MKTIIILASIIAVLVVALVISLVTRPKVLTFTESLPKDQRRLSKAMKFTNEIADYITIERNPDTGEYYMILKIVK